MANRSPSILLSSKDAGRARCFAQERSDSIRVYALARADGICEACGAAAPFKKPDGTPYLEVHHIRRLSDGGPDSPEWVAAICPNCHRRAHFGRDIALFNRDLKSNVEGKERVMKQGGA